MTSINSYPETEPLHLTCRDNAGRLAGGRVSSRRLPQPSSARRGNGPAAQHHLGARSIIGSWSDGDGVHAGPHERDLAPLAVVVTTWRAPVSVIAHGQRDPALPTWCDLDPPGNLDHPGGAVMVGVFR